MTLNDKIAEAGRIAADLARQDRSGQSVQDISKTVRLAHVVAESLQEIETRLEKLEEGQGGSG